MRLTFAVVLSAAALCGQGLEIISATYGAGLKTIDVTDRVVALVQNGSLAITVDGSTLGADPAPGNEKVLLIRYRSAGKVSLHAAKDFDQVRLPGKGRFSISDLAVDRGGAAPAPAVTQAPAVVSNELVIVSANWGWENRNSDVTQAVRAQVRDNRASFKVTNAMMGPDPAVGKTKTLTVTYTWQGKTYQVSQREDRTINIPDSGARQIGAGEAAPAAVTALASGSAAAFDNGRPAATRIFSARYMRGSESIDVRPRVEPMLRDDRLDLPVNPGALGVSGGGYLVVRYEFRGRTFERAASDGQTLSLP
ncbi:MAG: DUF3395 domain-containing protein [Acidobacteria bacterium]|nr:DUF3395 domain-containing protein [Acidobacteriota bacterium]